MVPLAAEIRTSEVGDVRLAVRRTVQLQVEASTSDGATSALILNLSEKGLLIETSADLAIGETFQVCLPGVRFSEAIVVWHEEPYFGCEFKAQVSKGTVSSALLLSPVDRDDESANALRPSYVPEDRDSSQDEVTFEGSQLVLITSVTVLVLALIILTIALFGF